MKRHTPLLLAGCLALLCATLSSAHAQSAPIRLPNIAYGTSGQLLDLWLPTIAHKRAVLLFIHGGGFKSGSKEDMQGYSALYAQGGFVTATMNYRLTAQNYQFPTALIDVHQAIRWLQSNATTFGYDANKVIVIGYSAGGNLALLAGLDPALKVAAIVSAAGPTELASLVATATMPQVPIDIASYLGNTPAAHASPLTYVHAGTPPTLFIHGDKDTFVPITQSLLLAQRLQAVQVPVLMKVVPNIGHEILLPNPELKNTLDLLTAFVVAIDQQP
jgi:acetyl esterase/lipase